MCIFSMNLMFVTNNCEEDYAEIHACSLTITTAINQSSNMQYSKMCTAADKLLTIRAATDQKTHGSDRFADQSDGSDYFSDKQKKKKRQDT